MFHPFTEDLSELKDSEIEAKISELTRKYFAAQRLNNQALLTQVATFVTIYKEELQKRYLAAKLKQQDKDLDDLINVD